ncbi:hydroxyisourate hydrolase [Priestia flexa]|uniref:hydroxyisourate hydrolase n=1 Tax=Priestia flexa TaxID=86664 RepID=UPI001B33BEC3|nr:hydroxyisourate hydrolase [Priestia flexa]
MTTLSTHVLDLTSGKPAKGIAVSLYRLQGNTERLWIGDTITNEDGRIDQPFFSKEPFTPGEYELLFDIETYFSISQSVQTSTPAFLTKVAVRVGLSETFEHYHVPLLVSPWGYQIYRGS